MHSLHGLLNREIGGLDCHVITTDYYTHFHCIHIQYQENRRKEKNEVNFSQGGKTIMM